jgi:hypothetical protein
LTPAHAQSALAALNLSDQLAGLLDLGDQIAALLDLGDQIAFLDDVAFGDLDAHGASGLRDHRDLHLHRLEDHQRVAVLDLLAFGDDDLPDIRDQFGTYFVGHRVSLRNVISIQPGAP